MLLGMVPLSWLLYKILRSATDHARGELSIRTSAHRAAIAACNSREPRRQLRVTSDAQLCDAATRARHP